MKDKEGKSRCFGFVNFAEHAFAVKAKEALDGKAFKWKDDALVGPVEEGEDEEELKNQGFVVMKLYVNRAQKKNERINAQRFEPSHDKPAPKTNLYIRNLADSVTEEDLRNLFKEYGVIKSCKIMTTSNGISRGFGFCDFSTTDAASDAIQKVSGHVFHGKPLYVAHAMKKQDRRAILENNPRIIPTMGGMYRPPMYPPNMYMQLMPQMYSYMRPQMFPRQPQYARPFHRQNQGRRATSKQTQSAMQQQPQAAPQMPVAMQAIPPMPQQQIPQQVPARQPEVSAVAPEAEKQQIGEQIYTRIMKMFDDQSLWGKLTGMLLESIPLGELQNLLRNEAALNEKIKQAKEYYDTHMPADAQ